MALTKIQKAWVERLRSGRDKQGRGALHREDGSFCCLGIACEMAVEAGIAEREGCGYASGDGYRDGYPPLTVCRWIGLKTDRGQYNASSLASDNDGGKTFAEIADIIEAHADEMFVQEGK